MTQALTTKLKKFVQLMKESDEQAQRGFELLLKRQDFDEFFDHLSSAGLFGKENNLGPVPADQPGSVYIPFWPALNYLKAVAKLAGEKSDLQLAGKVMDVVRDISKNPEPSGTIPDNYHTYRVFAEILGHVPTAAVAEADIDLIPSWIQGKFERGMVCRELDRGAMRRFLASDSPDDLNKACIILHHCTAIIWADERALGEHHKKPVTVVEDYWLKELINHHAKILGSRIGKRAAEILVDRVRETFDLGHRDLPSWLHRPAIEEHAQNHEWLGPENRFVEGLRDVLLGWVDSDLPAAKSFIKIRLCDETEILRRVGIHVLDQRWERLGEVFPPIISSQLFDAGHLHELYGLLRHHFETLRTEDKAATVEAIRQLPKPSNEDDGESRLKYIQRTWLSAIAGNGYEPADTWFNDLRSDQSLGGLSEHPDFHSYMELFRGPGPSPYQTQELLAFAEYGSIIERLNNFQQLDIWRGTTTSALVDTLEEAVALAPQTFLRLLPNFINAKRPFQYGVIEGFKSLWIRIEKNRPIDWDSAWPELIRFFEQLIGTPAFWSEQVEEDHNRTPNRDWIPPIIADFIRAGTLDDKTAYSPDLLPRTWALLEILLENLGMQEEAPQSDAMNKAINWPRGKAIEALFIHALRECRVSDETRKEHARVWAAMKPTFDAQLAKCKNANFEFSTLAGDYITNLDYLDSNWLHGNIERIFPRDFRDNFRCALDGLAHATVTDSIYDLLIQSGVIDLALREQLASGQVRERLIQRIALAYLWGHEQLDSQRFYYLFQSESFEDLEDASGWFWSIRKEQLSPEQIDRILQFLDRCISWSRGLTSPPTKLLSGLSRLSCYLQTLTNKETDWLLAVAPYVKVNYNYDFFLEELDRLADAYPAEVSLVLKAFLNSYVPGYDFEDRIKTILTKLAQHDRRDDAIAFADQLRRLPGMIQLYSELKSMS